jgi:hypothetical protein
MPILGTSCAAKLQNMVIKQLSRRKVFTLKDALMDLGIVAAPRHWLLEVQKGESPGLPVNGNPSLPAVVYSVLEADRACIATAQRRRNVSLPGNGFAPLSRKWRRMRIRARGQIVDE